MATFKLDRKTLPAGFSHNAFKYMGRPAKDQGDFGKDVGLADMCCVNQFGVANNAKYYHGGVVQATDGSWWVYLEWGRLKAAKSWNGIFNGQDYQFVKCIDETEARDFFRKQMESKNTKRLVRKVVAGADVWAAKPDDDGYLVQDLATREKGLPDAYSIKDAGTSLKVAPTPAVKPVSTASAPSTKNHHPEVLRLASSLVGGVQTYTRALSQATGVTPTLDSIAKVRTILVPAAMTRLQVVGNNIDRQVQDSDLRDISKMVFSLVPRAIPRKGLTDAEAILNGNTILGLQNDLDAFESALKTEDFTPTHTTVADPNVLLNAQITWLDPKGDKGRWIIGTLAKMTADKHDYLKGKNLRVLNLFELSRPDRDQQFLAEVRRTAAHRKGNFHMAAKLQPASRLDLVGDEAALYKAANVILCQHGTRSVNVAPIVQTHFRLPRQLAGVSITGANFGHGIYASTDFRKAIGYTSHHVAYWSSGSGGIPGRNPFMFINDLVMGDAYRAPSTGSWNHPPNGKDSVFGVGGDPGHGLQNDEHVVFRPEHVRVRYLVEFDMA